MEYTIQSDLLQVTVSSVGAELTSIRYKGEEKLWQNPTGTWAGHSPVLFPVCGHCGCKVNGKEYPMPAHGVVRKEEFTLVEQEEKRLKFSFSSNEKTKRAYPFDFVFSVIYQVNGNALSIIYDVENPTKTPLWFFCGGHESFNLATDVDGYKLVFDETEKLVHLPHDGGGYLSGEKVEFGTGKEFVLPVEYLLKGNTIIFGGIKSGGLYLSKTSGEKVARVEFKDFSNLLLWRPSADAKMICIEPWLNLPDLSGQEDVEFSQKAGAVKVDGGQKKTLERKISYFG